VLVTVNYSWSDSRAMRIYGFSFSVAGFPNLIITSDSHNVITRPSDRRCSWRIWILGIYLSIKDRLIGSHLELLYLTLLED
jgi:hypothetical protein